MAKAWCLPKATSKILQDAINRGELKTLNLNGMSSADRAKTFAKYVGDDLAPELNKEYERQIILKGYQKGLADWVSNVYRNHGDQKKVSNIETKISSLDERILNPANNQAFLQDLASEKLGFTMDPKQAKLIFDKAQEAKQLRSEWEKTLNIPAASRPMYNDPVVQTRIAYMRSVQDLKDMVESMKPDGRTWIQKALDVANSPKTFETGILHMSAPGVQAWGLLSHTETYRGIWHMLNYFRDEENYKNLNAWITSHPQYEYLREGHLGITDINSDLTLREEAIQSSLLQRLNDLVVKKGTEVLGLKDPLPINIVGASSRAFTGYLNYVRATVFYKMLDKIIESSDHPIRPGDREVLDLAAVINNFSGRANLDSSLVGINPKSVDNLRNITPVANVVVFTIRKNMATMQMFNPLEYMRLYTNAVKTGNFTAANLAVRNLVGSLVMTGSMLFLAQTMGYDVDYNPLSQNFAKPKGPNDEKWDITGGNAIYIRFLARMLYNKEITASGKEIELGEGYKPKTRMDLINQYVRGKFAPVAGAIADKFDGVDAVGRPFDVSDEVRMRFEPILAQTILNYYYDQPDKAITDLPILSSMFGYNTESPVSRGTRFGKDVWGKDNYSIFHDPKRDEVDRELDKLGYHVDFPSETINGVKLDPKQQETYNLLYGTQLRARFENLLNSQNFQNLPEQKKIFQLKLMDEVTKTNAQGLVMMKWPEIATGKSLENAKQLIGEKQ